MLVRRFIGKRLAEYYAQPSHKVVGRSTELEASSNLSTLLGEWHWKRYFGRVYQEREGHWLTPVELFQPHYSYVLGDFCAQYYDRMKRNEQENSNSVPLEIIELGGGRGTNAKWILSYLREEKPHVYDSLTSYTLVDSSPSLHKAQMERFQNGPHTDKVKFELKDLADVAMGTASLVSKSNVPTVVMGMEVLDNLPHDKIKGRIKHKLEQAEVKAAADSSDSKVYQEEFVPLKDPLLKKILKTVPQYYTQQSSSDTDALWVPTIACGVLQHAIAKRPNLGLVMADFDWLPPPDLDPFRGNKLSNEKLADWAPIVTDMDGRDHESYLTAPPHCDILFPTDFEKLASFAKRSLPKNKSKHLRPIVKVQKQANFLEQWGPQHVAKTKSWLTGHTPLLHDFSNCSVLTISPQEDQ